MGTSNCDKLGTDLICLEGAEDNLGFPWGGYYSHSMAYHFWEKECLGHNLYANNLGLKVKLRLFYKNGDEDGDAKLAGDSPWLRNWG